VDRDRVIRVLEVIIGDYLKAQGLDLVELTYRYEGRDLVLGVLADKPQGGISLGECANLNKGLRNILDIEGSMLQENYSLEVSSPGLDRLLKTRKDFLRCLDKRVYIFLNEPLNGRVELEGTINKVEGESVHIDREGISIEVPLLNIKKAKQIINSI